MEQKNVEVGIAIPGPHEPAAAATAITANVV